MSDRKKNINRLSTMQDIGGLRIIIDNPQDSLLQVRKFFESYKQTQYFKKFKNYTDWPAKSGYRGIHLVCQTNYTELDKLKFNNLQIEVQLRTKLQHIWATIVEIISLIKKESFKTEQGDKRWLNFFALVRSLFSYYETGILLDKHKNMSINQIIGALEGQKDTKINFLKTVRHNVNSSANKSYKKNDNLLVIFDIETKKPIVQKFSKNEIELAKQKYKEIELKIANGKEVYAVLLSINEATTLKKAYPNFFLETKDFKKQINKIINFYKKKAKAS